MEAKELMIGDWICENIDSEGFDGVSCWVYHQINAEDFKFFLENDWIEVDDKAFSEFWRPIPITPEILEKNGFVKRSDRDDKLGKMEYYQFEDYGFVYHYSDGEWAFNLVNENPKRRDFTGYLNYVHELQHVLNILKIEKEIKL